MLRRVRNGAIAALAAATACPALAAAEFRDIQAIEHNRSAFAGLTVRSDFGGASEAKAPQMRLGFGFLQNHRNSAGSPVGRTVSTMPLSIGIADRRVHLFAGDERLSRKQGRLGLTGEQTALLVIGGVAVGAGAIILLTDKEKDRPRGPCPPGVEVCAF